MRIHCSTAKLVAGGKMRSGLGLALVAFVIWAGFQYWRKIVSQLELLNAQYRCLRYTPDDTPIISSGGNFWDGARPGFFDVQPLQPYKFYNSNPRPEAWDRYRAFTQWRDPQSEPVLFLGELRLGGAVRIVEVDGWIGRYGEHLSDSVLNYKIVRPSTIFGNPEAAGEGFTYAEGVEIPLKKNLRIYSGKRHPTNASAFTISIFCDGVEYHAICRLTECEVPSGYFAESITVEVQKGP